MRQLRTALEQITPTDYTKYQALLAAIGHSHPFDWQPADTEDRLVIFTERIATLNWLKTHLARDLRLQRGQIETLHGGISDIEQQRVVEDFGNTQRPVRLLLCSDVASEGINLHYQCHRLIHFDMPWSLMVFQQRNGRVDRYGQTATPKIVYLVTESASSTVRGDTRILEVLMAKDEQAYRNIGDPSVFMDVRDVDEEEKITQQAIARGESAADFDSRLTPLSNEGEGLLAMFLQPETDKAATQPIAAPPPPASLFESDPNTAKRPCTNFKPGARKPPVPTTFSWPESPTCVSRSMLTPKRLPWTRRTTWWPGTATCRPRSSRTAAVSSSPPTDNACPKPSPKAAGGVRLAVRTLPVAAEPRRRLAERSDDGRLWPL